MLQLKEYQSRALEALKDYFIACKRIGNADTAFYETTGKWIGIKLPYQNNQTAACWAGPRWSILERQDWNNRVGQVQSSARPCP